MTAPNNEPIPPDEVDSSRGGSAPLIGSKRIGTTSSLRAPIEPALPYTATRAELLEEVERQGRELRLLHEVRAALINVRDMNSIFQTAVESIAQIFGFKLVAIYRLIGNELVVQAQVGYDVYYEKIALDKGINGRVASTGRGALVNDVTVDRDYLPLVPTVTSSICVPLLGPGNDILGTISIESDEERKLLERDYRLCQAISEHVTLAISQALGHEREKRQLTQIALLNHVGRDLAAALSEQEIIECVTGPVRETLNLYHVLIGLIEETNLVFRLPVNSQETMVYQFPLDQRNLTTRCANTGELVICQDVRNEPDYQPAPDTPDTRAEVVIPLRSAGQIIGVLDVQSDGTQLFEDDDIILLKTLADQTSVALANARRFADLQHQSEELNKSNRALAEANRLKSEFLANVSHELRTPLNSIIGYIDMIQTGFYGDIPGEMNDPLERVHRNGKRLMALINDVLDLANIEAGRMQISLEEVLVIELLPALAQIAKVACTEKNLRFQAEIKPGTPRLVYTDVKRLQQLVNILVSNAVKFTKVGVVSLTLAPAPAETLPSGKPAYCIAVADTGIGIAESEFENIFEEFRQVDGSSTRQFGGTGLGLGLAKRLVKQLGGSITVQSAINRGSVFTIFLPVLPVDQTLIPTQAAK